MFFILLLILSAFIVSVFLLSENSQSFYISVPLSLVLAWLFFRYFAKLKTKTKKLAQIKETRHLIANKDFIQIGFFFSQAQIGEWNDNFHSSKNMNYSVKIELKDIKQLTHFYPAFYSPSKEDFAKSLNELDIKIGKESLDIIYENSKTISINLTLLKRLGKNTELMNFLQKNTQLEINEAYL